jgi:hypothetical protein
MTEIDIEDGTPLFEKIMAHFGWYKAKKVDLQVEKMEANYTFIIRGDETEVPQWDFPVSKKPALKKATTRDNAIWDKNFKAADVAQALDKQAPKPRRKRNATQKISKP